MKPTKGRVVYYYDVVNGNIAPCTALITEVHTDTCINIVVFTPTSGMFFKTSVVLTDKDMETVKTLDEKAQMLGRWGWMPYQRKQATEEVK
jgi:hypothetical protein